MDETGIWMEMVRHYTIAKKGAKHVRIKASSASKTRATVMLCCSADGGKLPPVIIFKAASNGTLATKYQADGDGYSNECVVQFQKHAWNTSDGMIQWIERILVPYIQSNQPAETLVDVPDLEQPTSTSLMTSSPSSTSQPPSASSSLMPQLAASSTLKTFDSPSSSSSFSSSLIDMPGPSTEDLLSELNAGECILSRLRDI